MGRMAELRALIERWRQDVVGHYKMKAYSAEGLKDA